MALYDSGASISVMSKECARKTNTTTMGKVSKIKLADGKSSVTLGRGEVNVNIGNEELCTTMRILPHLTNEIICGTDLIYNFGLSQDAKLNIFHRNRLISSEKETTQQITNTMEFEPRLERYKHLFTGVGRTTRVKHDIKLNSDKVIRHQLQPFPTHWYGPIKEHVKELLKMDIIEPSKSPYRFRLVPKKKGDGTIRLAIDFRDLNAMTVKDAYPMPNVQQVVRRLGKAKVFSKIDLTKGYYQICLDPKVKHLTAFAFDGELYQFKVMPLD